MAIRCPNCQHAIELAGAKPGHYRPSCPACKEKFDLLISRDPNEPPRVSAIDTSGRTDATAPPSSVPKSAPQSAVDRTEFFIADPPHIAYDDLHGRLGGYDILQKLGQGGMGTVYLARQVSLSRNVALKTLSPTLASDPQFVARFTREAYAAAQLNHHNVVQIHDIGQDRGTNFFSMELVEGANLAGVVEKEGHLDPITAVNYTLQAARGLKFAHDHGLIHRDVKPENLLLNNEGVVKVADLGLVKRSTGAEPTIISGERASARASSVSATTTQIATSMGTPAYMAPEQARDAGAVDQRADIYSLGCTLYDLVTGRPPFSGRTAVEVMTKHAHEAIVPPEKIVANVPKRLSEIIRKMTAKKPEARYASMGEVVKELEDFLGVAHDGSGVRGSTDHVKRIEVAVAEFNAAPFAAIRRNGVLAFFVGAVLAFGIGMVTASPRLAGGAIAFCVLATLAYQITIGFTLKTAVFSKVRQLVFGASVIDWLTWLLAGALAVALLFFFGQLWIWLGVLIIAAFAGAMFHFGVDNVVSVQREEPVKDVEALIKELRTKGVDEDAIRGFVAKFSGSRWEEFYETIFGYEEKINARRLYGKGERGRDRKRFGVWRDWLIAWIDHKLEDRKADREQRLLAKLEARALEARGVQASEASRQARNSAANVVDRARALRGSAADSRMAETIAPETQHTRAQTIRKINWVENADEPEMSESLEGYEKIGYFRRRFGGPFDILLGRRVRFILAAVLLLGAGKWVQMNGAARILEELRGVTESLEHTKQVLAQKIESTAVQGTVAPVAKPQAAEEVAITEPLRIKGMPDRICDEVGSINGLVAGVLLLLSVPLWGHLMTVGVLAGTAVTLFAGRIDLPVIGATPWWLALLVGGAVALLSMLFLRRTID